MRLHWATEEQGHSRLHQSRNMMFCQPFATKERMCDVCDEITDVFHKLSQIPSTEINDDMEILVRFVSGCIHDRSSTAEGVYDARLEMFPKKQRLPNRAHVWSQSTVFHLDITNSTDWGWTKKTIFGRSSGQTFHYCGVMTAAD